MFKKTSFLFNTIEKQIFWVTWIIYSYYFAARGGSIATSITSLTKAIVNEHTIIIDNFLIDKTDLAFFGGHFYSGFSPALSFILSPFYFLLKIIGTPVLQLFNISPLILDKTPIISALLGPFTVALITALGIAFFYKLTGFFSKDKKMRLFATVSLAFGTIFFFYGSLLWARIISGAIGIIAFYFIIKAQNEKKGNFVLIGVIAGIGILFEYTYGLLLILFVLYVFFIMKKKKALLFSIGIIIASLPLLLYQYVAFNNPFITPYHTRFALANNVYQIIPNITTILEDTILPFDGLFIFCPILLIGLICLILAIKKNLFRKEMIFCLIVFIAFAIYISSTITTNVCAFGPRFFLLAIPFLALPLVFAKQFFKSSLIKIVFVISIFINLIGAQNPNICVQGYGRLLWFFERFLEFGPTNTRFNFLVNLNFLPLTIILELVLLNLAILFCFFVLGYNTKQRISGFLYKNKNILNCLILLSIVFVIMAFLLPIKNFGVMWLVVWIIIIIELIILKIWISYNDTWSKIEYE